MNQSGNQSGYDIYAYHLLRKSDLDSFRQLGNYAPASLAGEGFIHFSNEAQLVRVAARFYSAFNDLYVLRIPIAPLGAALKIEPALVHQQFTGHEVELFAHLYRSLAWSEVDGVAKFTHESDFDSLNFTDPKAS